MMCIFKLLFGLPCPGCGLTRANVLFFTGHFYEAFMMHPLFLVADIFLIYIAVRFFMQKKKATKPFLVCCLCIIFIYLIVFAVRFYFLFGKYEPFLPYKDALIFSLLRRF